MIGWTYRKPDEDENSNPFERLFKIFQELILHTSGDVQEALSWLTQLDKEYKLTDENYSLGDFIQDLIDKGYLSPDDSQRGGFAPSSKLEISLRNKAIGDVFGKIKKSRKGNHSTSQSGRGEEAANELKPFEYGDALDQIAVSESFRNAQVLMIDISHSMILYGEDRITPAKKVAMALAQYISTRYPKDTLDVIVFGDDAWRVEIKDLPYLEVGPYHTNTVAGLELAMEILRKRKNPNKQVFMITDGKPTCIKKGKKYIKNSFGLDRMIVNRTLNLARQCRKLQIPVTTFMIARDPYLMNFVDQFTRANQGKAFYSNLNGLGEFIFRDYKKNKS